MASHKWDLNKEDLKKVFTNALVFAVPALIVFLTVIQAGGTVQEASVALYTWGLSTALDALKKFQAGK